MRSYLYTPADVDDRLAKACSVGADAVIADLEDAVAASRKQLARDNARAWLADAADRSGVERWVRVNPGNQGLDDIAAVFGPALTGICLPKVSGRAEVERAVDLLTDLERSAGRSGELVRIMPLIESAVGVRALDEIADAPRVQKLQIGELDLAADLGVSPGSDGNELASIRSHVVVTSVAAGLLAPVGALSPDFRDLDALAASTEQLKRAGFVGRAAIHPAQLETIHRAYSVSSDEAAAARSLVERYETAIRGGHGVFVGDDGRMVDEAVIRRSRRTIELASATERGQAR